MNLSKLVGDFVEKQKTINAQLSQKIDTLENNVDKRIDGLQNDLDLKINILQYSISRLTNRQLVHQQEENPDEECLIDTIFGQRAQLQQLQEELIEEPAEASEELQDAPKSCVIYGSWRRKEEILPLITEEGSGKEVVEEPQKPILKPLPLGSLPAAPFLDPMHILLTPAAHSTPETPTAEAIPSALPMQFFRKLVAYVQTFATTSKKLVATHTAWHSGWLLPSWLRFGAPEPQY